MHKFGGSDSTGDSKVKEKCPVTPEETSHDKVQNLVLEKKYAHDIFKVIEQVHEASVSRIQKMVT